jgi:hypothetical protein
VFEIQKARINTAGAYICLDGLYIFTIGFQTHNGQIPIVRVGGHRDENETSWQCAVREVFEETNLSIQALTPPTTYLCDWDYLERELQGIQWQHETEKEPIPFLVVTYRRDEKTALSLMYLAHAEGIPTPSSEVKGLLLLEEAEIHRLCREAITLKQYLDSGGKAILTDEFNTGLVLEPFAQLRLLSRILNVQAETNAA